MAACLHTVWIAAIVIVAVVIIVHLLLFLIECAAEPAAKFAGALADVRLRVDDASWTTCSLVLHVSVVLTYHLV